MRSKPSDVFLTLSTMMLLYHLKDWAKTHESQFWAACPFARTLGEIANGTKHLELTKEQFTKDPHVASIVRTPPGSTGAFNTAPLNTQPLGGGFTAGGITMTTRRHAGETERQYAAFDIISEAFEWWRTELAP